MKKILPLLAVGILVLSGLGAGALSDQERIQEIKEIVLISEPIIQEREDFLILDLKEATSMLFVTGKPMIPMMTKTYTFPAGTKIVDVKVHFDYSTYGLSKKIQPSPKAFPLSYHYGLRASTVEVDENVYSSRDLYPSKPYIVGKTIGLKDGKHVLSLSIRVTPQYSPVADTINVPTNIDIQIKYLPPENILFTADEYDLLIITDEKFVSQLQPLVDHKNSIGVRTVIETTQNIYPNYDGRDAPEDIKLRIKDAIEGWGIKYVLLAGGRKGQTFNWYIPERRTNNDDGWEGGFASDLYYGDIYKDDNGTPIFEDWDSNGNGIFAEWLNFPTGRDIIDYDPDVSVGRIPFRYAFEIDTVINKIITYENSADDSWFKNAVVISGDTGPPCRGPATPGIYEGELATGISADLLEDIGFTVERLWLSLGAWSGRKDVINAISEGSGFIHMAGHGNPAHWGNFLPDAQSEEEMIDGLLLRDMHKLKNGEKLPVIVVGGCHNAQFNVTMLNFIKGILKQGLRGYFRMTEPYGDFWKREWVPRDFCSWLVMQKGGGAIASMGCSGLGLGYFNVLGLADWLEPRFFDAYANQSKNILGEAHDQAIRDYLNIIGGVNSHQNDRKTVEEWTLIGDPSLKIGGYE
ncbi:MAG: peptidase C25 [Thermoplasmatales archaeon]|nr:MAG: peptidase C25 [Thermoplasmatales archaeon]